MAIQFFALLARKPRFPYAPAMFDISFGELLLIGGVAILVIPPKDWPATLRAAGKALSHVRSWGTEARGMLDTLSREAMDDPSGNKTGFIKDLEGKWRETYDLTDFLDASRPVIAREQVIDPSPEAHRAQGEAIQDNTSAEGVPPRTLSPRGRGQGEGSNEQPAAKPHTIPPHD